MESESRPNITVSAPPAPTGVPESSSQSPPLSAQSTLSAPPTPSAPSSKRAYLLYEQTGYRHRHNSSFLPRWYHLFGLPNLIEYFISVDHNSIWRRHLAWSQRDGEKLRNAVTQRFASNMVFMSLLLGAALATLFSPSEPADDFREALKNAEYGNLSFWAGILLCVSIGMSLSSLVATFTAWAVISAVHPNNAHAVLRSSIGLYAAQLPARMVVFSIYFFMSWVVLFIFILLPNPFWSFFIAMIPLVLIAHVVVVYSSFGRLVMYSKAMGKEPIFDCNEEESMTPSRLLEALIMKAEEEKIRGTPLPLLYKNRQETQLPATASISRDKGLPQSPTSRKVHFP